MLNSRLFETITISKVNYPPKVVCTQKNKKTKKKVLWCWLSANKQSVWHLKTKISHILLFKIWTIINNFLTFDKLDILRYHSMSAHKQLLADSNV
jgi:hypothetical protein